MSSQAVLERPVLSPFELSEIEEAVANASHVGLFLDFDGTISPIVPRPNGAAIDPAIRNLLSSFLDRPDFSIAIISGREIADLQRRVALPGVMYAGNHGLEIEGTNLCFWNGEAESLRGELRSLCLQLRLALADVDGVEIEDKRLTLSVHYRRAPEPMHDWIVKTASETIARSRSFVPRPAKKVIEARPQLEWNKGHAVQWICQQALPPSTLAIYLGDDLTDEDAFVAVRDGITIKVGDSSGSAARYALPNVAAVRRFLGWLEHAKAHAPISTTQHTGERPALV
jgi:trehalose 6-phosphate phosphatase